MSMAGFALTAAAMSVATVCVNALRRDGWGVAVVADAGWTWSYNSANALDRRIAGIGLLITR